MNMKTVGLRILSSTAASGWDGVEPLVLVDECTYGLEYSSSEATLQATEIEDCVRVTAV